MNFKVELDRTAYKYIDIANQQGHVMALQFIADSGYSNKDIRNICEILRRLI